MSQLSSRGGRGVAKPQGRGGDVVLSVTKGAIAAALTGAEMSAGGTNFHDPGLTAARFVWSP